MDLDKVIGGAFSNYLTASHSSSEESARQKKFYVSDMGKCLRMRWLKRKGIKGEYGFETYYTFAHGDFVHALGYKAFEGAGILSTMEQSVETDHFSGRYDGKVKIKNKLYLFDIKSTNPYVLKRIISGGSDNIENIMQTLTYLLLDTEKEKLEDSVLVIYVNKLPSDKVEPTIIKPKQYFLENYKANIKEDMEKIVDYWNTDKIPPCTCPSWSIQKYNSFYPFCKGTDALIKKHLAYIKAGKKVSSDGYKIFVKNSLI